MVCNNNYDGGCNVIFICDISDEQHDLKPGSQGGRAQPQSGHALQNRSQLQYNHRIIPTNCHYYN